MCWNGQGTMVSLWEQRRVFFIRDLLLVALGITISSHWSYFFLVTSVAYVVGSFVDTFFIFHIFRIKNFKIQQCEHIEESANFSFQTQFLQFV
jgi:hypothetical protein